MWGVFLETERPTSAEGTMAKKLTSKKPAKPKAAKAKPTPAKAKSKAVNKAVNKAGSKAKGAVTERLAHRSCNTRKGAVAPVVPWERRSMPG